VSVNGALSEPFDISTGVLQGDVLAPFLFIIVIDFIMTKSSQNFGFIYKMGSSRRHPDMKVNDLDYADDIALMENLASNAIN
jgi:hypothetical protein